MDAWRYRDDDGSPSTSLRASAFDRFWRSVVAEGAAAGAALRLEFEHAIAFPGARQPFTLRYRSMTPASTVEASAVARCALRCAGDQVMARGCSWRDAWGTADCRSAAPAPLRQRSTMPRVTRGIAVSTAPSRPADDTLAKLERQARASGGVVTDEDNLDPPSRLRRSRRDHGCATMPRASDALSLVDSCHSPVACRWSGGCGGVWD